MPHAGAEVKPDGGSRVALQEVTPDGVRTLLFDDVINLYPYGENLIAYHLRTGEAYPLTAPEVASRYLEEVSATARVECAPYTDGDGIAVF
jgi:hypothetical protein